MVEVRARASALLFLPVVTCPVSRYSMLMPEGKLTVFDTVSPSMIVLEMATGRLVLRRELLPTISIRMISNSLSSIQLSTDMTAQHD